MPVIIAKIKSKKESIEIVKRALIEIAKYVNKNEKGTLNYFITQDKKDGLNWTVKWSFPARI